MPPLEKRTHFVPFIDTQDGSVNPKLRDVQQLSKFENARFKKRGLVAKRQGHSAYAKSIAPSGTLSSCGGVFSHDGVLYMENGRHLYAYSVNTGSWVYVGQNFQSNLSARALGHSTDRCSGVDCDLDSDNGLICVAYDSVTYDGPPSAASWDVNGQVVIMESDTGLEILNEEFASSTTFDSYAPRVSFIMDEDSFALCYLNGLTSGNIACRIMSSTTPSMGVATNIITDHRSSSHFSCISAGGGLFAVAYIDSAFDLKVKTFDTSKALQNTYTFAGTVQGLHAYYDAVVDDIVVLFWDAGTLKIVRLNIDMTAVYVPQTVMTPGAGLTPCYSNMAVGKLNGAVGSYIVLYTIRDDVSFETYIDTYVVNAAGAASKNRTLQRNAALVSEPFYNGDYTYYWSHRLDARLVATSDPFEGLGTLNCLEYNSTTAGSVVGRAFVSQHCGGDVVSPPLTYYPISMGARRVVMTDSSMFYAPFLRAERAAVSAPAFVDADEYDVSVVGLTIDMSGEESPVVDIGDHALIGSGVLRVLDGDGSPVAGLLMNHPYIETESTAAAGTLAAGDYGVAIVYRWTDGRGREYYSSPVFATATAPGANSDLLIQNAATNNCRAYFDGMDDKLRDVDILFYRTINGGSTYHLVMRHTNVQTAWVLAASPDLGQVTDASLVASTPLYTTGGILAATLPPTPHHMASDGETVVLIPGDNRNEIWVSIPMATGEGVRFTDDLVYNVPAGGDAEAVGFMDGRLIVWKRGQIRYMRGSAPNALGQGGYSGSELISKETGCKTWHSVQQVPMGFVFQSDRGFYLLGRDLALRYIGEKVEDYKDETVVSSCVLRDEHHVRFSMSGGAVLVWDYEYDAWYRWTGLSAVGTTVIDGDWIVAKSDATIGKESSSEWQDYGASNVTLKVTTGWLRLAGLLGYQRVRRLLVLGEMPSIDSAQDQITIKVYHDYNDETPVNTPATFEDVSGTKNTPFLWRFSLPTQKCSAIMIEIQVSKDAGSWDLEPLSLTGVGFEFGVKKGSPRLPAAQSK
jgi:hypothetical protein